MAAYSRVYDSRHLQADCQEPGSALEPYARQSSMDYLYLFTYMVNKIDHMVNKDYHQSLLPVTGVRGLNEKTQIIIVTTRAWRCFSETAAMSATRC